MVSPVDAIRRDPRWYHDVLGAGLLALAALTLTVAWAGTNTVQPPPVAWTVFVGAGLCSWLFLISAARSAQLAAVDGAELRGLLLVAMLLAQVGFVLRLSSREPWVAGLEWAVFLLAALLFLAAHEAGRRAVPIRVWAVVVGVLFAGATAAVILTPHTPHPHIPQGPRLYWQQTMPAAVLAAALAGAIALCFVWRPEGFRREAIRAHVVAVPPLAVYAFTRDPGAAVLMCGATAGVVFAAGRLVWGMTWPATLRPLATGVTATAAVATVLRLIDPERIFSVPPVPPERDLIGVWQAEGAVPLTAVGGRGAAAVLTLLVVVFAGQVSLLVARALRPDDRRTGTRAFQQVWAVALGGQVLVSLLAPLLIEAFRLPGPSTLTALPFAGDGASFVLTFAALGMTFAAAQHPDGSTAG